MWLFLLGPLLYNRLRQGWEGDYPLAYRFFFFLPFTNLQFIFCYGETLVTVFFCWENLPINLFPSGLSSVLQLIQDYRGGIWIALDKTADTLC